jgi:hypothetical protein
LYSEYKHTLLSLFPKQKKTKSKMTGFSSRRDSRRRSRSPRGGRRDSRGRGGCGGSSNKGFGKGGFGGSSFGGQGGFGGDRMGGLGADLRNVDYSRELRCSLSRQKPHFP